MQLKFAVPNSANISETDAQILFADVVVEYAKTLPQPIAPATDGRLTVIGGVTP
jgi:hypothetical protein